MTTQRVPPPLEAFDLNGVQLVDGDRVAVAVTQDRSAVLRLGVIESIHYSNPDWGVAEVKVRVRWDIAIGYSNQPTSTITPHSSYRSKSRFLKVS